MSVDTPKNSTAAGSRRIPTLVIIGEILVNCFLIWYLLVSIPTGCAQLAAETAGRQTCGIESGAYVISAVSAILVLIGLFYLAKWYVLKRE